MIWLLTSRDEFGAWSQNPALTHCHGHQDASLQSCGPNLVRSGKPVLSSGPLRPEGAAETVPSKDRLG